MYLLAVCLLIIGLPSLLILGLVEVAHELLSRSAIGAPTYSDTDASQIQEGARVADAPAEACGDGHAIAR